MRNGRVDQWQQFTFCLWGVIEDFLADIGEGKHDLLDSGLVFDVGFSKLEELESWNEFLVDVAHALKALDDSIQVELIVLQLCQVATTEFLLKREDFAVKILGLQLADFSQTEVLLWV